MAFYETICYFDVPNEIKLMLENGVINSYCYCKHKAEGNDLKDHYHLLVECSSKDKFKTFLFEEFKHRVLILNVRSNMVGDRVRYYIHDYDYLLAKGQLRLYYYNLDDDLISDCPEFYREQFDSWNCDKSNRVKNVVQLLKEGNTLYDLVYSGMIPINQISMYKTLFDVRESALYSRDAENPHIYTKGSHILEDGINYYTLDENGTIIYDSRVENFGLGIPSLNAEIDFKEYSKRKWLFNHRLIDSRGHILTDNCLHCHIKVKETAIANGYMNNDFVPLLNGGFQNDI